MITDTLKYSNHLATHFLYQNNHFIIKNTTLSIDQKLYSFTALKDAITSTHFPTDLSTFFVDKKKHSFYNLHFLYCQKHRNRLNKTYWETFYETFSH